MRRGPGEGGDEVCDTLTPPKQSIVVRDSRKTYFVHKEHIACLGEEHDAGLGWLGVAFDATHLVRAVARSGHLRFALERVVGHERVKSMCLPGIRASHTVHPAA